MSSITIAQAIDLASQQYNAGQYAQAEGICRQILQVEPRNPAALHLLGAIAIAVGNMPAAAQLISDAIASAPQAAQYHSNLCYVLLQLKRYEEAIAAANRAISLNPLMAEAYLNMGCAYGETQRPTEAAAALQKAVELDPNSAAANSSLAAAYNELERFEEAVPIARRAIELMPTNADAYSNLSNCLREVGELEEALAACRRAVELNPNIVRARTNMAACLHAMGRFDEALVVHDQTLSLEPNFGKGHWNKSLLMLLHGDFEKGWKEYEWRWHPLTLGLRRPAFRQPEWDGSDLSGKTILLYAEQGFGDTIHFVRYAPIVAQRGGKIILKCHTELKRLLKSVPQVGQVLGDEDPLPPHFDTHMALMSLPRLFKTTLETIPHDVPYVFAEPELMREYKSRLPDDGTRKVGLLWTGRPTNRNDRYRSIALARFAPLASAENTTFVSLQVGPTAGAAKNPPAGMKLLDFSEHLKDFADTAALIMNLDLVIAVDTAATHLAGALNKPVWTLLPFVPDWRWMLNRTDTPWYPSMTLFRQPTAGDWTSVMNHVATRLA